jgi:tetratricopeptide (TPR) repeat protein
MAHDVFISYANKDKPSAEAICAALEHNAIRCWIAPRNILAGMKFGESIIDAIGDCRIFVLVLSSSANESPYVLQEVKQAFEKRAVIIPFRIEEVFPSKSLEFFISTHHWLDAFTHPLETHLQELADTIKVLLAQLQEREELEFPAIRAGACPYCGGRVAEGHLFCPQCGSKIQDGEEGKEGAAVDQQQSWDMAKLEPLVPVSQPEKVAPSLLETPTPSPPAVAGEPQIQEPPADPIPGARESLPETLASGAPPGIPAGGREEPTVYEEKIQLPVRTVKPERGVLRWVLSTLAVMGIAAISLYILHGTSASYYLSQGLSYLEKGRFDEALDSCARALEKNPILAEAHICQGRVYIHKARFDEAIAALNRALEIEPGSLDALKNRALAYQGKSNYPQAVSDLDNILRVNPKDAQSYLLRGDLRRDQDQHDLAVADYRKALELQPDIDKDVNSRLAQVASKYYVMGSEYSSKGKYAQAISEYSKAINLNPKSLWFYYNDRAVIYAKLDRYNEAITDLDRALDINKNSLSYWNKAVFCEAVGRFKEAIEAYKQFIFYTSPEYAPSSEHYSRIPKAKKKIESLESKVSK